MDVNVPVSVTDWPPSVLQNEYKIPERKLDARPKVKYSALMCCIFDSSAAGPSKVNYA